jgi:DNA-binding transcriptional LysR family regulator
MEMHQIRYFLALCQELNFTRAARRCDVAQPSLTNAVKRLERGLGAALFERGQNSTRLTEFGRLLRPHFEMLDQCAKKARRDAQRFLDRARAKRRPARARRTGASNSRSGQRASC